MALKKNARAHIRLTLEHAEVRLQLEDGTHLKCKLKDLSEGGCRCRVPIRGLDKDEVSKWQKRFLGSKKSEVEFQIPPDTQIFKIPVSILNAKESKTQDYLELGIRFETLEEDKLEILRNALMSCAAKKLRDTGQFSPLGNASKALGAQPKPKPMTSRAQPPKQIPNPRTPIPSTEPAPSKPRERVSKRMKAVARVPKPFQAEQHIDYSNYAEPLPGMASPRSGPTLARSGPARVIHTPAAGVQAAGYVQTFPHRGREISDVLVLMGLLSSGEAVDYKEKAASSGKAVDSFLLQSGRLAAFQLTQAWALQSGLPVTDLNRHPFNATVSKSIPHPILVQYECVPYLEGQRLGLAAARPLAPRVVEELSRHAEYSLSLHLAPADQIAHWLGYLAPPPAMPAPVAYSVQPMAQHYRAPVAAPPPQYTAPKQSVRMCEVDFSFSDSQGRSLISEVFTGWLTGLESYKLWLEGPYWSGGLPMDPTSGKSYLSMVMQLPPHPEIRAIGMVQSAAPVYAASGGVVGLLFELDIVHMNERDRQVHAQILSGLGFGPGHSPHPKY